MRGKQSREKVATLRRMNVTGNSRRNGFSFAELIAAIALITLMFGLVAQINIAISSTVLRNELHLAASEEIDNIIEQISTIPYEEITTDATNQLNLIRTKNRVASWELSVEVSEETNELATKRIEVVLESPSMQIRVKRVYWKTKVLQDVETGDVP